MGHWLKITFETFTNNPAELGFYLYHHLKNQCQTNISFIWTPFLLYLVALQEHFNDKSWRVKHQTRWVCIKKIYRTSATRAKINNIVGYQMFILPQTWTRIWWFCWLTEGSMSKLLNSFIHLETRAKFL